MTINKMLDSLKNSYPFVTTIDETMSHGQTKRYINVNIPCLSFEEGRYFYIVELNENGSCVLSDQCQLTEYLWITGNPRWNTLPKDKDIIEHYVKMFDYVDIRWTPNGIEVISHADNARQYTEMMNQLIAVHCFIDGVVGVRNNKLM